MSPEEQPEQPETAPPTNSAPTAEEMEAIKAQLEEERKAKAAAEAALATKDAHIAQLEASLSEAKKGSEAAAAELTSVKDAHSKAVNKYLDAVKLANPTIPGDVIAGSSIEEIDASLAKANLEAEAKEGEDRRGHKTKGMKPQRRN